MSFVAKEVAALGWSAASFRSESWGVAAMEHRELLFSHFIVGFAYSRSLLYIYTTHYRLQTTSMCANVNHVSNALCCFDGGFSCLETRKFLLNSRWSPFVSHEIDSIQQTPIARSIHTHTPTRRCKISIVALSHYQRCRTQRVRANTDPHSVVSMRMRMRTLKEPLILYGNGANIRNWRRRLVKCTDWVQLRTHLVYVLVSLYQVHAQFA